jgi:hypothetical protein
VPEHLLAAAVGPLKGGQRSQAVTADKAATMKSWSSEGHRYVDSLASDGDSTTERRAGNLKKYESSNKINTGRRSPQQLATLTLYIVHRT